MEDQKNNKKKKKDKRVDFPLKVPQSLREEIVAEATEKGVYNSTIALYRLQHHATPLTPALLADLQNRSNAKYEEYKDSQPEEAQKILEEAMALWRHLN